ncbi:hypothetical protein NGUA23_04566 [Salmonella enterica]|nr:hypothetical protein NGUA23_04566 [Salmonella enterica]
MPKPVTMAHVLQLVFAGFILKCQIFREDTGALITENEIKFLRAMTKRLMRIFSIGRLDSKPLVIGGDKFWQPRIGARDIGDILQA